MTVQSFNVGSVPCYYSIADNVVNAESEDLSHALTHLALQENQAGDNVVNAESEDLSHALTHLALQENQAADNVVNAEPEDLSHLLPHLALQENQAADTEPLWDPKKLFLTFDDREVFTLSGVDLENFFNKEFPGCIQSVTLSQDRNGYVFGTVQLEEGHTAEEVLQNLPSRFFKVRSQWVKTRKFYNRYPPF